MNEQKPQFETIKFDDLFSRYVIKTDKEMVRRHTDNDFGLDDGFLFLTGTHINSEWTTAWGWFHTTVCRRAGAFNACKLTRSRDGQRVAAWAKHHTYPGQTFIAANVTDIPADVLPLIGNI